MFSIRKKDTCLENMDSFDARTYDETLLGSKVFREMEEKGQQVLETFPSLQRDIWGSLYKYNPKLKAVMENKDLVTNYEILRKVVSNPDFTAAMEYTRMDELAAGLNTLSMSEKLMDIISGTLDGNAKQKQQELKQLQNKAEQNEFRKEALQQKMDSLNKKLEAARMEDKEKIEQQLKQIQQQLKQAKTSLKKAESQANKVQEELQQGRKHIIRWLGKRLERRQRQPSGQAEPGADHQE